MKWLGASIVGLLFSCSTPQIRGVYIPTTPIDAVTESSSLFRLNKIEEKLGDTYAKHTGDFQKVTTASRISFSLGDDEDGYRQPIMEIHSPEENAFSDQPERLYFSNIEGVRAVTMEEEGSSDSQHLVFSYRRTFNDGGGLTYSLIDTYDILVNEESASVSEVVAQLAAYHRMIKRARKLDASGFSHIQEKKVANVPGLSAKEQQDICKGEAVSNFNTTCLGTISFEPCRYQLTQVSSRKLEEIVTEIREQDANGFNGYLLFCGHSSQEKKGVQEPITVALSWLRASETARYVQANVNTGNATLISYAVGDRRDKDIVDVYLLR